MIRNERILRLGIFATAALLTFLVVSFYSWWYTTSQLSIAGRHGVFPTAEQGMRELVSRGYVGITQVDVVYAGPSSFRGANPHVWYVIAEVRATSRIGGSGMGRGNDNCDAPGSFFLNVRDGWVPVPEGAFPELVGFWMKVYGLAGPGLERLSIEWDPSRLNIMCTPPNNSPTRTAAENGN